MLYVKSEKPVDGNQKEISDRWESNIRVSEGYRASLLECWKIPEAAASALRNGKYDNCRAWPRVYLQKRKTDIVQLMICYTLLMPLLGVF